MSLSYLGTCVNGHLFRSFCLVPITQISDQNYSMSIMLKKYFSWRHIQCSSEQACTIPGPGPLRWSSEIELRHHDFYYLHLCVSKMKNTDDETTYSIKPCKKVWCGIVIGCISKCVWLTLWLSKHLSNSIFKCCSISNTAETHHLAQRPCTHPQVSIILAD